MAKLTGLSLSFCVGDVLRGDVAYDSIGGIIAGTMAADEESWEDLIKSYQETYWSENPQEAERIVRQLRSEGKIDQPRLRGEAYPYIGDGHWLNEAGEKVRL